MDICVGAISVEILAVVHRQSVVQIATISNANDYETRLISMI